MVQIRKRSCCKIRNLASYFLLKKLKNLFQAEIATLYENYQKHNNGKNLFSAARTPAVLFTMTVAFYVMASLFGLIGVESLANLANLVMVIFLVLMLTWFYVRYSGEYRSLAAHIDQLADALWDNVSGPGNFFSFCWFFF